MSVLDTSPIANLLEDNYASPSTQNTDTSATEQFLESPPVSYDTMSCADDKNIRASPLLNDEGQKKLRPYSLHLPPTPSVSGNEPSTSTSLRPRAVSSIDDYRSTPVEQVRPNLEFSFEEVLAVMTSL